MFFEMFFIDMFFEMYNSVHIIDALLYTLLSEKAFA